MAIETIIIAIFIIAGFIGGIRLMQSPRTAHWGNRLGALSMLIAIIWAFIETGEEGIVTALLFIIAGSVIGLILGQSVKMIHMPQTVGLLNGLGGAASALVAGSAVMNGQAYEAAVVSWSSSSLALAIGTLTFGGSLIAVLKLHGIALQKPFQLPFHGCVLRLILLTVLVLVILNSTTTGEYFTILLPLIITGALLGGLFMTLRIGGADMPIIISLLNSLSGIAAAIAGIAVKNIILAGTGTLVGVAGLILTRVMCRAMNRSLLAVLTGFSPDTESRSQVPDDERAPSSTEATAVDSKEPSPHENVSDSQTTQSEKSEDGPADTEEQLPRIIQNAESIIIVPGYGMAVAQAQQSVRNLANALEKEEKEVHFGIHPVAGRMPGHMNVLLAEAGIDYEKMLDQESINPRFEDTDLVIVIGACDVINPAANAAEDTPISGMPILEVEKSKNIIICNLDEKPGYSGVDNPLYNEGHVITLWGDAAQTVPELIRLVGKE